MKCATIRKFLILGVCGSALLTAHAEKVQIEQLPQALQDKIRAYTGDNRIQDIDMQTKNGQVTYEVGFKQNDQHTELRFNSDGQLLNQAGAPALGSGKIEYNQLPAAVQQVVNTRVQQGNINDIDRRVKGGDVTYEVGFKHGGVQQELLLSEDGRILRDVSYDRNLAVGTPGGAISAQGVSDNRMLSQTPVQLSSSQQITMEQVPAEARQTILLRANGARIEDIEVGQWNNIRVYQAAYKSNGQHVELQVAANGQVVHNPMQANQPGLAADIQMISQTPVRLASSQKITMEQVPAEARRTILMQAEGARIEDIEVGEWNNMRVYQAAFKKNRQNVELQVAANGQTIHNPLQAKTSAVGRAPGQVIGTDVPRREIFRPNTAASNLPVNTLVPLSSSQVIGEGDLPQSVQTALSQHAPGADLQRVERGIWSDRIVYQFNFVDNGRLHHLQLDQTGKLVHDTRFPNRQ